MKECRCCFDIKPLSQFYQDARSEDGHRATCKSCYGKRRKELRLKRPIGLGPHSIEESRRCALISKCFEQFNGTKDIEIPVNAVGNPHSIKRGCIIRPMSDQNRILITTLKGVREYQFELVSPALLLEILKELHLQVTLP